MPVLALLALALVAAGVQLGDGAVPIGDPRSPAATAAGLGRPAAQISAGSPRVDGVDAELAAAIGAIGVLNGPGSGSVSDVVSIPRPVVDSPAEPGALPAPQRSPQPAPAPGTSPPEGPLDPPPAAGEIVGTVEGALEPLAPLVPLAPQAVQPVIDGSTGALADPVPGPLSPLGL